MVTKNETAGEVAKILGIKKANWARVNQCQKQALESGFTHEDFIEAAKNMAAGDEKYYSIYSVFLKTDYWLAKEREPEAKPVEGNWAAIAKKIMEEDNEATS